MLSIHTSDFHPELLRAGDFIRLSGTVLTARDAAHKRLIGLLDNGEPIPFPLAGRLIYYAGPTPAKPGRPIGSCGPTTSGRMDRFTPRMLDCGVAGLIGKGERNADVCRSIVKNRAVYLCAAGGAGALLSRCIISAEVIAFPELGCEAVRMLEIENMPMVAAIDCYGGNLFLRQIEEPETLNQKS